MVDNSVAYKEFRSLWEKAKSSRNEYEPLLVEGENSDVQVLGLLPQLSQLADKLNSSDIIDSDQFEQMQAAIAQLREVIQTVDHNVLADVLRSLK